jgi:YrbI family 3-deoxy-D-manno-octulosonate 8-phosphate phosphatase
MTKKYTVVIPVRGGSKSIPLKNIKPMAGRPLLFWSLDAANECNAIDRIYVSTDSSEIRQAVDKYIGEIGGSDRIICFDRDPKTATDTASTESVLDDFSDKIDYEYLMLMQATSPLITSKDLEEGIRKYELESRDSLLSVVRQKRFIWEEKGQQFQPVNYDFLNRPRRQEFEGYYVENGAFYITSKECYQRSNCRISGNIGIYEMDEQTYYEIDEPSDWDIIENLLRRQMRKQIPSKKIKLFVTDCDGVMTDGGMYYSEKGDEMKKFNTIDGKGIELLRNKGIKTCIITGEDSQIVLDRAAKLRIDFTFKGVEDKLTVLSTLVETLGITLDQVAYLGDDINDIDCIQAVGYGFAVPNARDDVKMIADFVLSTLGGKGAIREAAEMIVRQGWVE